MAYQFRHAMCNEAFKGWDFAEACKVVKNAGYTGIELAPFTLADHPAHVTPEQRREYRKIMLGEGLEFVGLHWLLVSPTPLHVTTPDKEFRERSWEYVRDLTDLCADLGPGGVMVFGSPQQRSSTGGLSRAEATANFVEGLWELAPHAEQLGVTLLVEALPSAQSDVVQSLEEAAGIVEKIGSPAVRTMFDSHNAVEETEEHAVLLDRYFDVIRHVHVNETDGKHCGQGDYDFRPILKVLQARDYQGWVSLEVFDFAPGPDVIARESLRFLETQIERVPA